MYKVTSKIIPLLSVSESPVIVRWNDVGTGISISDRMTPHNSTFVMLRNVLYFK